MKIIKINENSISLTIKNDELKERNIKLSDLSYGSKKARDLLLEVIGLAKAEVGFDAKSPLAVEVVPLKEGDLKLIITTDINLDELDSRFSNFSPIKSDALPITIMQALESTIDKFEEVLRIGNVKGANEVGNANKLEIRKDDEIIYIFQFDSIDKATDACLNVNNYDYNSVFYKDEKNNKFFLVLSIIGNNNSEALTEFNKVCNTLAEYGKRDESEFGINQAYFEEHYKTIIKENAVYKLSKI